MIEITTHDGVAEAYVARPAGTDTPAPGIVYFHDLSGLRPFVKETADRMASWGYVVLVPNLFYREGTAEETTPPASFDSPEQRQAFVKAGMERIGRLTPDLSHPDIATWVQTLAGLDGVADGPIGVVGYCMGVRLALRAAGLHPGTVAAVAGFHGGDLVTEDPRSPHQVVAGARDAAFTLAHAHRDDTNTAEQIAILDKVLDDAGLQHHTEVVEAMHGYSMPDNPNYDEAGRERHFELARELFDRVLRD